MGCKKMQRLAVTAAVEEAGRFGCAVQVDGMGSSSHLRLLIVGPRGGRLHVPVSLTPKNERSALNMVLQKVRQRCRELTS